MRNVHAVACVLFMMLVLTVGVRADLRFYSYVEGHWKNTYTAATVSGSAAFLCSGGGCAVVGCEFCHDAAISKKPYTTPLNRAHFDQYFVKTEHVLPEGATLKLGGLTLQRQRGRLNVVVSPGKLVPLPLGARILKDRSGRPGLIAYEGTALPPLIK